MNSKLLYVGVASLTVLNGVVAAGDKCSVGFEAGKVCAGSGYIPRAETGVECAASPCDEDDFKNGANCCERAENCPLDDGSKALETACQYSAKDSEGNYATKLCAVGKFYFRDASYKNTCSDEKPVPKCERENTGKEALVEKCQISTTKKDDKGEWETVVTECEKGKYFWGSEQSCEDKVFPCKIAEKGSTDMFAGETYCGPRSTDTDEEKAGWNPEFKGACQDLSTCDPDDIKELMLLAFSAMGNSQEDGETPSGSTESDEPTVIKGMCPILIRMTSKPGKCQAVCMGGQSSAELKKGAIGAGCTEEEVEQLSANKDASAKAQGLKTSSATTAMTSVAAATAMAAVIAALW